MPCRHGGYLELRHLRYFVAVAEEGSVSAAAERRLFTSQPSLSRQLQALEDEVGAQLLLRGSRGVELTAAGKAFLDHARLALAQVEAAGAAAREAAAPSKPRFALGFLTGQEMDWLPQAMRVLSGELARIDVTVSSQYSPGLAQDLLRRKLDVASCGRSRTCRIWTTPAWRANRWWWCYPATTGWRRSRPSPCMNWRARSSSECRTRRRCCKASSPSIWSAAVWRWRRAIRSTIWRWPFRWSLRRAAWRCCRRMR